MNNKKRLAKGLMLGVVISNPLIDSVANYNCKQNCLDISNSLNSLGNNEINRDNSINQWGNKEVINRLNKSKEYAFDKYKNYEVYDAYSKSNISILEPSLEFNNNTITIIDNGAVISGVYKEKEGSLEEFNSIDDIKYDTLGTDGWMIENGMLKTKPLTDDDTTEITFMFNAREGEKLQMRFKTESSNPHYSWIRINSNDIYTKYGPTNDFEVIEADLEDGRNAMVITFELDTRYTNKETDGIYIDYIKILEKEEEIVDCETLEYRINSGDWQVYNNAFELNYPSGTKVLVEARAKYNGITSSIFSQEIIVESNNKDVLDRYTTTSNLDLYIQSKNMLSMTLSTNNVSFEEYSGIDDLVINNAINININSSLPYQLSSYMISEIESSDKVNRIEKDLFNIKTSNSSDYKTFANINEKLVLENNCNSGNNKYHNIDFKLSGSNAYKADVYKTTLRFEVEQK